MICTPIEISQRQRPALRNLIAAMERLSRRKRQEIARAGSRAPAAKEPTLRRLTSQAAAEARRIAQEARL